MFSIKISNGLYKGSLQGSLMCSSLWCMLTINKRIDSSPVLIHYELIATSMSFLLRCDIGMVAFPSYYP